MLIYSRSKEQSPRGAKALLQIEIAGGLLCDLRLRVIYLSHSPLHLQSTLPSSLSSSCLRSERSPGGLLCKEQGTIWRKEQK